MKLVLIIICICAIIWLSNYRKKIDEEEKVALKTPGTATRLRQNYGELIDLLLSNPSHLVLMERSYDESIRIGNISGQELFVSYSSLGSELRVACVKDSVLIKEWIFKNEKNIDYIYQEISYYFN